MLQILFLKDALNRANVKEIKRKICCRLLNSIETDLTRGLAGTRVNTEHGATVVTLRHSPSLVTATANMYSMSSSSSYAMHFD